MKKKIDVEEAMYNILIFTLSTAMIIMIILITLGLMSLFMDSSESSSVETEIVNFEIIGNDHLGGKLMVDKNTGVLYNYSDDNIVMPIYNSDGTLKMYKE